MSAATDMAFEVARELLGVVRRLVGRDAAHKLLDEEAVGRAERFGELLDEEKFGPDKPETD